MNATQSVRAVLRIAEMELRQINRHRGKIAAGILLLVAACAIFKSEVFVLSVR